MRFNNYYCDHTDDDDDDDDDDFRFNLFLVRLSLEQHIIPLSGTLWYK